MKGLSVIGLSVLTGLLTSILGAYIYAGLQTTELDPVYIGVSTLIASTVIGFTFLLRHKARLLSSSGIIAYYPRGQSQYIDSLISDLRHVSKLTVVGARGRDLVGEETPIGTVLSDRGEAVTVRIFLIDPEGNYGRLRSGHLDIERDKYQAECQNVQRYVKLLKIQARVKLELKIYSSQPRIRLVMSDAWAYIAFYAPGTRGRDLPSFKISSRVGPLYRMIEHYLDYLDATSLASAQEGEVVAQSYITEKPNAAPIS